MTTPPPPPPPFFFKQFGSWYPAIMAAVIALGSNAALAQPWPSKPIRAFIPFAAGSATDIVPRALFEPLGVELGQSIIVENRGGAGHRALDRAELSV